MTDVLTPVVNVLAQAAILLALVRWYLALNKLWTRKHIPAVVGSLSTVNISIGLVSLSLNMTLAATEGNIAQAVTSALDVMGVTVL
ncbi:MAG: hypothetical protein AAF125_14315, partial [Chloroflexota bacterium]